MHTVLTDMKDTSVSANAVLLKAVHYSWKPDSGLAFSEKKKFRIKIKGLGGYITVTLAMILKDWQNVK